MHDLPWLQLVHLPRLCFDTSDRNGIRRAKKIAWQVD